MKPNVTNIVCHPFMVGIQISTTSQIKKIDIKLAVLTRYTSKFSLNDILTKNEKS